jgi:hypothetical protein
MMQAARGAGITFEQMQRFVNVARVEDVVDGDGHTVESGIGVLEGVEALVDG